jgi:hypothetical protein
VLVGGRGIGPGLLSNVAVSAASGVSGLRQLFGMASDPDGLTHDDLRNKTHLILYERRHLIATSTS